MALPLALQATCSSCNSGGDLFLSQCTHSTLCASCGKALAEKAAPCKQCKEPLTRLLKEFAVRINPTSKTFFVGKFANGLPGFGGKKSGGGRWSLHRDGAPGKPLSEAAREKYKSKPWILEDDRGHSTFQGQPDGAQTAAFYLLVMHGKDFVALPAGTWYSFQKQLTYKTFTLEEAEEVMKGNRRKRAELYKKWAGKGAEGEAGEKGEEGRMGGGGGRRRMAGEEDDFDLGLSEQEEEEQEEEEQRAKLKKGAGEDGGEEEEESAPKEEAEGDEDEKEKGEEWEHEETFTDDDEAVGMEKEEREDAEAADAPPPRSLKEEDDDEEEEEEEPEEAAPGAPGKELRKMLVKGELAEEEDAEDEDEDDDDEDMDIGFSIVFMGQQKDVAAAAEEAVPAVASGRVTPPVAAKRKAPADEAKPAGPTGKRPKTEPGKIAPPGTSRKPGGPPPSAAPAAAKAAPAGGAPAGVTEEALRAILKKGPIKSTVLVAKFKGNLKTAEDKKAFQEILKKVGKIQKIEGTNYIGLR